MSAAAITPSSFLKLLCYVKGEHYNHAFPVEIGKEKWVADLKDAIKEKKKPDFNHITADSLVLWKVSIPHDPNLADNVNNLSLVDDDGSAQVSMAHPNNEHFLLLSPAHKLSKVFSEPLIDEHVHLIVKPPPVRSTAKEADLGEKDDIITALKTSSFLPL